MLLSIYQQSSDLCILWNQSTSLSDALFRKDTVSLLLIYVNLSLFSDVPHMLYDTFSVQDARLKLVKCVKSGCNAGIEPLDVV